MKCAVEGCTQEASKNHGFEQTAEIHGVRIKVSGLLCEECFQQTMNGGRKKEEEPKQGKRCAICGKVVTQFVMHPSHCAECYFKKLEAGSKQSKAKTCSTCGVDAFNDLEPCEHCEEIFCVICINEHWQQVHVRCYFCGGDFYSGAKHTIIYCRSCWEEHGTKEQSKPQKEKCADCGKEFSKLFLHPYCIECFQRRQNQQKNPFGETYTYHINWDPLAEETFQKFFGGNAHFYSGSTAGQQQTKTTSGTYTYLPAEIKEAFKVLGIEPVKDTEAIKKAYKALALVKHPDVGGKTEDMVKLNKAKDVALKWVGGR